MPTHNPNSPKPHQPLTLLFPLLIFHLFLSKTLSNQTIFLIETFRHGSRKPEAPLPTFNLDLTRESYSDLTTTGMRNHFFLGKLIKKKFPTLFANTKLTPDSVHVYTSSNHRTVNSAMSQLSGLSFETGSDLKVETPEKSDLFTPPNAIVKPEFDSDKALVGDVVFYPMDVMDYGNNYMFAGRYTCSNVAVKNKELNKNLKKKYADLFAKSYEMYENKGYDPSVLFENKVWDLNNVIELSDMIMAQIYDKSEFKWDYELMLHSQYINTFNEYLKGSSKWVNKVVNYEFINSWVNWLEKLQSEKLENVKFLENILNEKFVRKNENKSFPKIVMYSGHDTNIASLKKLLVNDNIIDCMVNNYNQIISVSKIDNKSDYDKIIKKLDETKCYGPIPFASNLIFEVYTNDSVQNKGDGTINYWSKNNDAFVRFWLNNEAVKIDGKDNMKLKEFIKYLKSQLISSFVKECGAENLQPKNPQTKLKVFAVVCFISAGLVLLILGIFLILIQCSKRNINDSDVYQEVEDVGEDEVDE